MKRKRGGGVDLEEEEEEKPEWFVNYTYTQDQRRNWHFSVFNMVNGACDRQEFIEEIELKSFRGTFNLNAQFFAPSFDDHDQPDEGDLDYRLRSKEWRTLLGEAILHGDHDVFDELLLRGVDPELPCAYEIVRITSAGPVMHLYRPLTYALCRGQFKILCKLLQLRVNLADAPTDAYHTFAINPYRSRTCVHEFGRYVRWVDGMYALTWLRHRALRATPLKDVIDHVTAMTDMMRYTEWTE